MKKLLAITGAAAIAAGAYADTYGPDDSGQTWTYTDNGTTITLTGVDDKTIEVDAANIPWTIENKPVVSVAGYAFDKYAKLIGTLTIPDSVTNIGAAAFRNCTGLTAIASWGGVTQWGTAAFSGCTNMSGTFPDLSNATSLGEGMLQNVPLPGELKLGSLLTSFTRLTFNCCCFGGTAVVPTNVTTIGSNSNYGQFCNNPNLEAIWVKGKETSANQTYTTAYVYNFAGNCPSLKMVLMGKNTKGAKLTSPLSDCTDVDWFEPANGYWDGLTTSNIGGTNNKVWKYGPGEEFDLEIDDVKMTATFTPTTEAALTNVLSWASAFKTHFGLDTVVSITNSIAVTEGAVTPEMLQNVKLDSPSWFMTFAVKTQAQLNTVLEAVDGPIVADITGAREEITVPAGRQVAILVPGGATFNYRKRGLIISFR